MDKPDLSKLEVEVAYHEDNWQQIKDNALFTIHKKKGKYPDTNWKNRIIRAEHSPIRTGKYIINIYNCPSFVFGHLVRHFNGSQPFIASLRSDRAEYDETPNRNTLQDGRFEINYQGFINISRKRLCNCASYETRYVWGKVIEAIKETDHELYKLCVKECVYRNGLCPEMFSCKYNKSKAFKKELKEYQFLFDGQICEDTKLGE